jgi:hypothetical protein
LNKETLGMCAMEKREESFSVLSFSLSVERKSTL